MSSEPPSPNADDFRLHAWVDESMRAAQNDTDGIYLMAAAIADPSACDEVRDGLRAVTEKKAERLHWRHETPERQAKIAATIGNHDVVNLVVVGTPLDARRQERARRICTERLLYELDALGVAHVWLEARHPALNERDLRLVKALRGKRSISSSIRVDFARPKDEPMLWIPDAVAGAVNGALSGAASVLADMGIIDLIEINLP
ncbi:hypothetical protein ACFS27_26685 [Promicromonospora vindobonensis]|uniref:Uncharacterized protein n=1 Tax=Promicromonospora vindobonensis TaxID=195748 RepID=A0ABW5VZU6_9MICO